MSLLGSDTLLRLHVRSSLATKPRTVAELQDVLLSRLANLGLGVAEREGLCDCLAGTFCAISVDSWLKIPLRSNGITVHCGDMRKTVEDSRLALGLLQIYLGERPLVPAFQAAVSSAFESGR